jgi:hypothetical protein
MLTWFQKPTPKNRLETPLLRRLRLLLPAAVVVAMGSAGFGQPASAIIVSGTTDTEVAGNPINSLTDPTFAFDDSATDTVQLTIVYPLASGGDATADANFNEFAFLSEFYFNFSDSTTVTLSLADTSGPPTDPSGLNQSTDGHKADGDGNFDALVKWTSSTGVNQFEPGDTYVGIISGVVTIGGAIFDLSALDFKLDSVDLGGGGKPGFCAATRLQGLPDTGSPPAGTADSDFLGGSCIDDQLPPPNGEMPEPASLLLFGIGLLGLGVFARRRRFAA